MADQQRWFKLWTTAPSDDHIQRLSVPDRWAWAVLGCYTKTHGTNGVVQIAPSNEALAAQMGIPVTDLVTTLRRLPHVTLVEKRHGEFTVTVTVTWDNWLKYQKDSTQAERAKRARASRSKKRREEKRKEEKRTSPLSPHTNGQPTVDSRQPRNRTKPARIQNEVTRLLASIQARHPELEQPDS